MDQATYHGIFTVILFSAFVWLVINVMKKLHKKDFDEAARLPLEDEQE